MSYQYSVLIRESHLDTFGHVNNATYLQLYEEARWELMTRNGYDLSVIQKTGLGPVILSAQIQFLKELKLREQIQITIELLNYESKVGQLKQKMLLPSGEVASEIVMSFGLFDTKARKLVLPTPEWLKAIQN